MEHKMFSIYDNKAQAYLPPFILPRLEMAMRTFADCVNAKDHKFSLHPGDYTLVELGDFDDNTATIKSHTVAIVIGTGLDFKESLTPNEGPQDDERTPVSNDAPVQPNPISGNSS